MGAAHFRMAAARRALVAASICALATGCATASPEDVAGASTQAALFKAQVGDISGGVSPGPHSVWYVQRQPVAYVKMGFATWEPDHSRGLRGWWSRHFGRHAKPGEPTAVAARNLNLPVPSRVQVTNVASGQMITVRVDDKAQIGGAVLRLSPDVAKSLGGDPGKPLLIRLRYLAPVVAYNERPSLRYALRGAVRHAPAQPAPTALAQAAPPAAAIAPLPARTPPSVIKVVETTATAPIFRPALPAVAAPRAEPAPAHVASPAGAFRVQAGAFANLDNAHHAVRMLAVAGPATIEPVKHGAMILYRVIVPGAKDVRAAERLRAQVAEAGFTDARILKPL